MTKQYPNKNTNKTGLTEHHMEYRQKGKQVEFNPGEERYCKYCGSGIVWLQSKKGKSYPVDWAGGIAVVWSANFHKCARR